MILVPFHKVGVVLPLGLLLCLAPLPVAAEEAAVSSSPPELGGDHVTTEIRVKDLGDGDFEFNGIRFNLSLIHI